MLLFRVGAPTEAVETMTVSLRAASPTPMRQRPIEAPLPDGPTPEHRRNPPGSYWNISREKAELM